MLGAFRSHSADSLLIEKGEGIGMPMTTDWGKAQQKAARTAKWTVTMAKVRIRRVLARTRWQLVSFYGPRGRESVGVVDLLAVRKDHGSPKPGMKRGDALQIILIQVKGGGSAMPTAEDARRLRAVAKRHRAEQSLLAIWKKGKAARFLRLQARGYAGESDWTKITNLNVVFR